VIRLCWKILLVLLAATGLEVIEFTAQGKLTVAGQFGTANQRTQQTRTDASYVNYTYDNIGQLESALGFTSGGSPLSNDQRGYRYDPAWNLNARTNNGVVTTFGVNVKNELTTQPNGAAVYDANGNLTSDGLRIYIYDDENQLIRVSQGTSYRTDFIYDGLGRMRYRQEYYYTGSSWALSSEISYFYDGRRVIQERIGGTPNTSYTRG
jgi:YD repeat-containing protein